MLLGPLLNSYVNNLNYNDIEIGMKKLFNYTSLGFISVLMALVSSSAFAESLTNAKLGLVKNGAFLLSEKPTTPREGQLVHNLVGYLPTGTRVIIEKEITVTNLSSTDDELYYFVKSELGISGLLREDLLVKSEGRKLAISVSSIELQIHQPNATLKKPTKRFKIGRHGGDYFEITGESEKGFYDVLLHRANYEKSKLPATEKARLKKLYIKRGLVSILDPSNSTLLSELNNSWNSMVNINDSYFDDILNEIQKKIGNVGVGKLKNLLGSINNLQCLLKTTGDGEFGFKVFSNGFSIKLEAQMKESGIKYLFDMKKLSVNGGAKFYSGISSIKCNGNSPIRMQKFTLQEGIMSESRRYEVALSDLESSKSKWINTLQGDNISEKMVRISGWEQYNKLIKKLNEFSISGDSYLKELPERTRLVLLNYIVSRISFFEHRDLIVKQDANNT